MLLPGLTVPFVLEVIGDSGAADVTEVRPDLEVLLGSDWGGGWRL